MMTPRHPSRRAFCQAALLLLARCVGATADAATNPAAPPLRAMWVYETEKLLGSAAERTELYQFCAARQITDLFWQTHFESKRQGGPYEIRDATALKGFLHEATTHGLHIHALAGDPAHTLRENHEQVLARVAAFVAFNQGTAAADERFAGLHLDIEPHALPAWQKASNAEQCALLTQLVELHAKIVEKLHAEAPGTLYGADITFWLDKVQEEDGTPVYPVTFRGVTKDPTKHLLDMVDNLGLMSYRNQAEGKNGLIALVARAVAAADTAKGRVFVGVKMADIGAKMETFYGSTEAEMNAELQKVDETYTPHRGYAGLAFFMYPAYKTMPPGK